MSAPPEGTTLELSGPGARVLGGRQELHVVESGTLALFRAEVRDGEPSGPRRFLGRVGAGQPVLSAAAAPACGERLLIVPIQRAALREVSLPSAWSDERARREVLTPRVSEWVDVLARMPGDLPEPTLPVRLEAARPVDLDDGQDVAAEHRKVLWVRVLEGRVDLLGDEQHALVPGDAPAPLAEGLWLRARGSTRIEVLGADGTRSLDELMAGVIRLQTFVLERLARRDEREAAAEMARLDDRSRLQARRVRDALGRLVSVLEPLEITHVTDDPLLAAARVVGDALGVEVRGPAASEDPARRDDPLEAIARASRLRMRRVQLGARWWRLDAGPLVGWEQSEDGERPVALLRRRGRYEVLDPESGLRRRVGARLAARLSPEAVSFSRPLPEGKLGLREMARFVVHGRGRDLLLILCVGVGATLLGMLVPVGTAAIMDHAVPDANSRLLLEIGLALGAAVLGQALFGLSERIVMLRVGIGCEAETQSALWDRLLRLRPSFFRGYSSGDLQSRVMAVHDVGREVTGNVMNTLFTSLLAFLNLGLLVVYSPTLSLLALGVAAVVSAATLGFGLRLRGIVRELLELDGRFFGLEIQLIQGVGKLRVAGAELRAFTRWLGGFTDQLGLLRRALRVSDASSVFNVLVTPVSTVLLFVFALGALRAGSGEGGLTLGTFLAFNAAFATFLAGVTALSDTLVGFLDTATRARRIAPIVTEPPEVDQRKADPGRLEGRVELSGAQFRYRPDGPRILEDVSLVAEPGEFVALVGPSGSGKSTVLRLLLGFETPESGTVTYDGQDLATLDVLAVRRQLGVVLQNGRVAVGTVLENIGGGVAITLDEAWAAAEDAGFGDDVREMPMGMHTILSEGGGNLSGGQRQRLLIARALATRPRLLFLDEATSALDNRTQAVVSESLERLRVTRLVVAHRLSTIRRADRIYVLEAGRVVEQGGFDELMAREGLFRRMMARQLA